jgi:hypothetical protein
MILLLQALIVDTIGANNTGFDTVYLHRPTTCWLKCCCSFSLARLMQNCSNEFVLNDSNP